MFDAASDSVQRSAPRYNRRVSRLALPAALAAFVLSLAGEPAARQTHEPRFRSRVDVIAVTATVRDANGGLVAGLTRDDFEVFEDGVRQPITQFASGRVPIGLGLLLDISDSMRGRRIVDARAAVARFLVDLLDPADEFFVVAFNHEPRLIAPWMQGPDGLDARLAALRPWGGTALYDAVLYSLPFVDKRSRHRAALVVISDGADTASDASVREVRMRLLRSDAFVYAIAVDPPAQRSGVTRVNPGALRQITDDSGGRTAVVHDTHEIASATERIAEELNQQYVLGFNSSKPPDGEFHSLRVRVKKPGHRVQARRGYVAGR
jgi:Ca-activated chloride channel family protein